MPIDAWPAPSDAALPARDGSPEGPFRAPGRRESLYIPWRRRHSRNVAAAEQALEAAKGVHGSAEERLKAEARARAQLRLVRQNPEH